MAKLLSGASMLLLPLIARGTILGFFACTRQEGFRRFDAYDVEIGMDFASRAAVFFDNARRYSREHATALTLQRSMLPTGLSYPSSVEVRHRYLPGSKLIEVGGDWYESIALPGGRVALVVGDVAGHGVRAAVTMGRLRTAIHTLAMLELPPADSLQQLDELMHTLGEREPHFATCAYADLRRGRAARARSPWPATCRRCSCSRTAATNCSTSRPRRRSASATARSRAASSQIEDGSLFVLYTDGLVENKGRDISDGLARLRSIFGAGLADQAARGPVQGHAGRRVLRPSARRHRGAAGPARRLPEDHHATWTLGRS